jgi:AcrR family transcriptional regulator
MVDATQDKRLRKGERTRRTILTTAAELASLEGLEPLSIGALADRTRMSKSGLFAHFGSKEELQLATVEHARRVFVNEVIVPAESESVAGLDRVRALCRHWLDYCERGVFPGGCFFSAVSAEYRKRPGAVRDRVVEIMDRWTATIAGQLAHAKRAGELSAASDSRQLAFELQALVMGANWEHQLHGDAGAFKRARTAIDVRLDAQISGAIRMERRR